MITKGIVEELKGYQAKVRLPIYDGLANTKNATSNENLSYATVCVTTNLNNSLNVGDIVYVSFEDNDKGKPVILGQLYKEEMNTLADMKLNSANINQLTVNKNASLPQNTSIGSISSKEIAALSGIKDNIQNQIDINLPAINFAESERQKSETDGAITHNLDAPVVFAENERQKSKNLFNTEAIPITSSHVTYDKDTNTFTYTINDTIESADTSFTILKYGKLKPGTYTMSFNTTSTIGNNAPVIVAKLNEYDGFNSTIVSKNIIDGYVYLTFTLNEETNIGLAWYYKAGWIAGDAPPGVKTLTNLQLEEGSIATDYQSYNGQIVHEKQLPKITTLWTNPNPSNDFSSQTITLANDNFDYAIMICGGRTNELNTQVSFLFEKGTAPILNYVLTNTDAAYSVENLCRRVVHTNNTTLNIGNCTYSLKLNSAVVANNLLIPYKVIGIKIGD